MGGLVFMTFAPIFPIYKKSQKTPCILRDYRISLIRSREERPRERTKMETFTTLRPLREIAAFNGDIATFACRLVSRVETWDELLAELRCTNQDMMDCPRAAILPCTDRHQRHYGFVKRRVAGNDQFSVPREVLSAWAARGLGIESDAARECLEEGM